MRLGATPYEASLARERGKNASAPRGPDRRDLVQRPRHALPQLVLGPQRYVEPRVVLLLGEHAVLVDLPTRSALGPGLGGEAVDDAVREVVRDLAGGAADDDGPAVAEGRAVVRVVGLDARRGLEAEPACECGFGEGEIRR